MGELYRITFPNGKAYIGITSKTARLRLSGHRTEMRAGSRCPVHRALKKWPDVTSETLVVSDDWAYLCDIERRAIKAFGTLKPGGYNLTEGGDGVVGLRPRLGIPHTAESKAKMSARRKGRPLSPSQRANVVAALVGNQYGLGHQQSDEHRNAIRTGHLSSKRPKRGSRSGVRGVAWCSQTQKWRAHLTINGKMKHLGRFPDIESAAAARAQAARAHLERAAA